MEKVRSIHDKCISLATYMVYMCIVTENVENEAINTREDDTRNREGNKQCILLLMCVLSQIMLRMKPLIPE